MFTKVELSGRIAYSQLDDFDNRIYAFEQVPLFDYPLYTYSFSGIRFYMLTRIKPTKQVDIWFRYALARHDIPLNLLSPNYTIGSGLDEIDGNNKHTFTLQIRYLIR